ncbi:hypothetical protein MSMEI_6714 [Mycolicibacterium smegmatis MC2 155]|uniref:Uncharacterized protein n=1 Tax=Mycolicibacterium smegmatis (strain ATCC 700084 / mc(2)155) TaxID=246196 RepID=I7FPC9_MYCS2|nr:hypothetical protein MSMEI_6714 [Mycolicibacterium smegmatis MC2 155]
MPPRLLLCRYAESLSRQSGGFREQSVRSLRSRNPLAAAWPTATARLPAAGLPAARLPVPASATGATEWSHRDHRDRARGPRWCGEFLRWSAHGLLTRRDHGGRDRGRQFRGQRQRVDPAGRGRDAERPVRRAASGRDGDVVAAQDDGPLDRDRGMRHEPAEHDRRRRPGALEHRRVRVQPQRRTRCGGPRVRDRHGGAGAAAVHGGMASGQAIVDRALRAGLVADSRR